MNGGLDELLAGELRAALAVVLADGMATDPLAHAEQIAGIMTQLDRAFRAEGLRCVLVGGAAIEIQAPGAYMSHDIDLVVDTWLAHDARLRIARVFDQLAFTRTGRHWERNGLYIEIPGTTLEDPAELYDRPPWSFTVVRKEVLLRDRLIGFKYWGQTAYAEQAIAMLSRFGSELDMHWLGPQLARERIADAYDALRGVVARGIPVSESDLDGVLDVLHGRPAITHFDEEDDDPEG